MTIDSLSYFNPGLTPDNAGFKDFAVLYTYEFNDISGADVYKVNIYLDMVASRSKSMMLIPIVYEYKYFFAFAFKNNKLLYWGFPDDFTKADDPVINKLGESIVAKLLEEINN